MGKFRIVKESIEGNSFSAVREEGGVVTHTVQFEGVPKTSVDYMRMLKIKKYRKQLKEGTCKYSVVEVDRLEKIFGFTEDDYQVLLSE